jgi:DNA modification methylase
MIEECKGNVVMFTNPERKNLPDPDERLYWVKPQRTMNYKKHCGRFVETILVYRKGGAFNELYWQQMTGIYHDLLEEKPIHPHQKPLSMMRRLVQIYTDPGDLVLDPFMGYGTTGMACKLENRHFIGIEIDPFWYRRAVERIDSLE